MSKRASGCAAAVVALVGILSVGLAAPAAGQDPKVGRLRGRITDGQGALPGATVTIRSDDASYGRTFITNANGELEVGSLPAGRYQATIELEGFQTVRKEIDVRDKETTRLDVGLEVSEEEEIVVVGVAPPDFSRSTPMVSARAIESLPLQGRNIFSLGVGIDGGPVDAVDFGLNAKLTRSLGPGLISPGWEYDPATGTAGGPATDEFRIRLDAVERVEFPSRLKIKASYGREEVFDGKVEVERRPAPDPSAVPYLGLPDVVSPGGQLFLTPPPAPDARIRLESGGWEEPYELGGPQPSEPPDWFAGLDRTPLVGVLPYGEIPGSIGVTGVGPFGETLFVWDWQPVVVADGLCTGGPVITGGSDLNFAGQQLCVCGCFADAGPLGQLQIGGRPLGPPSGVSPYVANFVTPADLAPGRYEVGWAPGAGGGGLFQTEVIEIQARINDEVIQKGGTTGLEMDIIGTDRALPIELDNRSPGKVSMSPSDSIKTRTTGGPGRNHVPDVKVTGLKTGKYFIDWKVDAGACPCAETLPTVAEAADEELDLMVTQLVAENRVATGGDAGDRAGGVAPGDAGCGGALSLRDGRFRVEITWQDPAETGEQGSCRQVPPAAGLFAQPGASNWELLLKVLDGCGVNDHFWVFAGALTDVEYSVTVTDTANGQTKSYDSPLGRPAPAITDTSAFATCP